jgi:hypothetical protein
VAGPQRGRNGHSVAVVEPSRPPEHGFLGERRAAIGGRVDCRAAQVIPRRAHDSAGAIDDVAAPERFVELDRLADRVPPPDVRGEPGRHQHPQLDLDAIRVLRERARSGLLALREVERSRHALDR